MRRLPFLSRSDRRALLLLEWILVIALVVGTFFSWQKERTPKDAKALHSDSIRQKRNVRTGQQAIIYAEDEEVVETFCFDPNTADSTALLRLGLAPWQVRSVYRYRAKHGRYHTAEDFKQLPGMTNEMWERLSPYIRIDAKYQYVKPSPTRTYAKEDNGKETEKSPDSAPTAKSTSGDNVPTDKTEKYAPGTLVDINTADTNVLKGIPGIASYRARKIVEYREKMGGFVNAGQAMEACRLPDDILEWLVVNPDYKIRKVNVNTASVPSMMKHPYISFYQARDIYELRTKNGKIESIDTLVSKGIFTSQDAERLLPYIAF